MAAALVVRRGPRHYLVAPPPSRPIGFPETLDPVVAGRRFHGPSKDRLPDSLLAELGKLPAATRLLVASDELANALRRSVGRPVELATLAEVRTARAALPREDPGEEREFLLAVARERLEVSLRSPEEILITLAREEERLERALGREERAAEAFLPLAGSPLADYGEAWSALRSLLTKHHERLEKTLARSASEFAPNLSAVVGERVAARLIAAAGGMSAVARMRAPRLQLLGSRRRPSPEGGPRYGLIYRAARMNDVPLGRRGAYARSLAALAAIAARADATTRADLTGVLVPRRDRRIEQLRRSRR